MDRMLNFLDIKRWLLLTAPFFILTAGIYIADYITQNFVNKPEVNLWQNLLKKYQPILYTKIPDNIKKFDTVIFEYFYFIPVKNLKIVKIKKPKEKVPPPPVYRISLIYIRDGKKYVVINGRILTEGSRLSDKEYIVKIEKDGVLVNGAWGYRWIKL